MVSNLCKLETFLFLSLLHATFSFVLDRFFILCYWNSNYGHMFRRAWSSENLVYFTQGTAVYPCTIRIVSNLFFPSMSDFSDFDSAYLTNTCSCTISLNLLHCTRLVPACRSIFSTQIPRIERPRPLRNGMFIYFDHWNIYVFPFLSLPLSKLLGAKMPGGRTNILSMSALIDSIEGSVSSAKDSLHSQKTSLTKKLEKHGLNIPYVDLKIHVRIQSTLYSSSLIKLSLLGHEDCQRWMSSEALIPTSLPR